VAQEGSQQVPLTKTNGDRQAVHAVLKADPVQVLHDVWQTGQVPLEDPLLRAKYLPSGQEEQCEEDVPMQSRQVMWQQAP